LQLFLLHFAGGNRYSYDFIVNHIKSKKFSIVCHPLELPGRGRRYNEELLTDKQYAINDYVNQIVQLRDNSPYVIFGHSMGATLGLSVVKRMEEKNDAPLQFIATGNPGPGINEEDTASSPTKKHLLNDEEFKATLRKLGGIPEEILENEELFGFFSEVLRADFQILEEGNHIDEAIVINTPIFAIMGSEEKSLPHLRNWEKFTNSSLKTKQLEGNHFFIHEHTETLVEIILNSYKNRLDSYFI